MDHKMSHYKPLDVEAASALQSVSLAHVERKGMRMSIQMVTKLPVYMANGCTLTHYRKVR